MASDSANAVRTGSPGGASEANPSSTDSSAGNLSNQPSAASQAPSIKSNAELAPVSTPPTNQSSSSSVASSALAQTSTAASEVPAQSAAPGASTVPSTSSFAPWLATASSLLPRSTTSVSNHAASSSTSSSSGSGTATPTRRAQTSTHSPQTAVATRISQHARQDAARGRRSSHQNPTSRGRFISAATAMASTDNSTAMPSIFGYYSHNANPTSQATSAHVSTSPTAGGPVWRVATASSPASGWRSAASVARADRSSAASPNASIRVGSLSFYRMSAESNWDASATIGTVYRSARAQSDHTAAAQNAPNTNVDTSIVAQSLLPPQPTFEETTTISFTWTIQDLHLLREEVEQTPPPSEGGRSVSAGAGKSDVWTNRPVFGDNKWKLELVRTTRSLPDRSKGAGLHQAHSVETEAHGTPSTRDSGVGSTAADDEEDVNSSQPNQITILSVYLTSLQLEYAHPNIEIPASIMIGLRPIRTAAGSTGAQDGGYLWRRFYDYTFQKEADLFTCDDLPSVSEMLQDVNVSRDDAVALTIQLGLGPGYMRGRPGQDDVTNLRVPVEVEGHHFVPKAVINSLSGLLDDANTGDVRILVRERGILSPSTSASMSDGGHQDALTSNDFGRVVPYPVGSSCPTSAAEAAGADALDAIEEDPDRVFVRDRVLWAHASVLKSRSDYFQTMLASDFSEGIGRSYGPESGGPSAGRSVRTLRVPDADFVTTYWFLRYLYTADIRFADKEDVRSAVLDEEWAKGADLGYLTAGSSGGEAGVGGLRSKMLVDWTPISQLKDYDDFEMDEAEASDANVSFSMSRGQASSSSLERRDLSGSFVLQGSALRTAGPTPTATTSGSLRQRSSAGGGNTLSAPTSPSVAAAAASSASNMSKHHTTDDACRAASSQRARGGLDPHSHPCSDPGPASALSIFRLAHRYHMQDLSKLASLHMVATLTPQSAFPMLLATSMYTELHTRIKTYVYQHWHLVSHTQEFERCCDEVSVGMWGADAGKTMRAFVRSLVSPLRAAQS